MPFPPDERERLLAAHGVGPTVIARLEQIGYQRLADLALASATDINAQIAALLGTTCWRNRPQARPAIANAIAVARDQSPNTSSKKSSIIR
nr:helix-hairpin-helix domain-containing protein [Pseudoxanthomonas sp.]